MNKGALSIALHAVTEQFKTLGTYLMIKGPKQRTVTLRKFIFLNSMRLSVSASLFFEHHTFSLSLSTSLYLSLF